MYRIIILVLLVSTLNYSCQGQESEIVELPFDCPTGVDCSIGNVLVTAPEIADIYVDGRYTGRKTPAMISLTTGEHLIGTGLGESKTYLRKTVDVPNEPIQVVLDQQDLMAPITWKALFIGVPEATGLSPNGRCSTHFTTEDLDDAFEFFKWNLQSHIEPFSFNTIKWDISRQDLTQPAELTKTNNGWYTLESPQGLAEIENLKPGDYDVVFLFWRAEEGDCNFESSYFGLAWLDPTSMDTQHTGYITVKFNPGEMAVAEKLDEYKRNDPGVWTHEWLHVVIEQFYPDLGVDVPTPAEGGDGLVLHAAGAFNYKFPWMKWYEDLIGGKVREGSKYVGIGPDALLKCSIRDAAMDTCQE